MSYFSRISKPIKIVAALSVAALVLLGTEWAGDYLRSAKAGNHVPGQSYQGQVKYLKDARMGRDRYRENDRVAVVETEDKREILVHDLSGRFDGCESEDEVGYRMEESAVNGVAFVYIPRSCQEP